MLNCKLFPLLKTYSCQVDTTVSWLVSGLCWCFRGLVKKWWIKCL